MARHFRQSTATLPHCSWRSLIKACTLLATVSLATGFGHAHATVYSDAEDGLSDWRVFDAKPAGAEVLIDYDEVLQSNVIQTSGAGRDNGYILGGTNSSNGWNNTTEFHINWRLQATETFNIYVRIDTTDGWRYLVYNAGNSDALANSTGTSIRFGLGSTSRDGTWRVFSRDLAADLARAQPDNQLLAVNGFLVRGSVRLDDITLAQSPVTQTVLPPVSSVVDADAEDDSTAGWRVFDNNPVGATISVVADELNGSKVYELAGAGRSNGYRLGGYSSVDGWNNQSEFMFSWDMRTSESYNVLIRVDTTNGWRYLNYTQSNSDQLLSSNGRNISYGLGSFTRDEQWRTFTRDLAADVANGEPGNTLTAVQGLFVRGSMRLDNIRLSGNVAEPVAPVAVITGGDRAAELGENVVLDGSGSSDDSAIVSYVWKNSASEFVGSDPQLTVSFDVGGVYAYTLTVTDDAGLSDSATTQITVEDVSAATVYENAEDAEITRWQIADATPAGFAVANVFDVETDSRVIQFTSTGQQNSFLIGFYDSRSPGWNNSEQTHLSWSMNTSEGFAIYVQLETTDGPRALIYDQYNGDRGSATASSLRFGLGRDAYDGSWQTFTRNVYADLAKLQPDNSIIAVHGMQFRGNLLIDNIEMLTIVDQAPVAALTADPLEGVGPLQVNLDAGDSTDDNGVVGYTFDFGDGSEPLAGDEASASHVYVAEGDYTATVTVSDSAGQTSTAAVLIKVLADSVAPVAAIAASTTAGEIPLSTVFSAEASTDNVGIVNYAWDFGDGTLDEGIALATISHDYLAVGDYTATVTVSDAAGNSDTASIVVTATEPEPTDQPPVAAFTITPFDGSTVSFVNTSTDDDEITSYAWDFGDGTETGISSLADPSYSFSAVGDYTVGLTVKDSADQTDTTTQLVTIASLDEEPVELQAIAAASALTGDAPFSVTLDASASTGGQGELSFQWLVDRVDDAGEPVAGSLPITGSGVSFEAVLPEAGNYLATLTVVDELENSASTTLSLTATDPVEPPASGITPEEAARFLTQATFGTTDEGIARVQALGFEGWIDEQFTLQGAPHLDFVLANSNGSNQEARHEIWWRDVVDGDDQLRQRIAFALSQIFVISDQGYTLGNAQYGVTHYYDQLRENAFGNYRDLLETVTLSPVMGVYLSMLQNEKADEAGNTRADENFAREVLQLFSIGLHELNSNGTVKLSGGQPIPAFTQSHVENYARVFTGWNFGGATDWTIASINGNANKLIPMEAVPQYHDTGAKTLLGGVKAAAGLTAEADLELALDTIAGHANVGPFIAKHLIQKLVTSNPTPAYVGRVASAFNNNGSGVRGDFKAVVKAILLDSEARNGQNSVPDFGKLREPVLRLSHLWRAFNVTPGSLSENGVYNTRSPHVKDLNYLSGQAVLKSPSVFNFFLPDFAPLGPIHDSGKSAPEAQIYTDNTILAMTTRVNTHIQYVHDASDTNAKKWAYVVLAPERALAAQSTDALLDRLNLLMLSGGMSDGLRTVLTNHLESLPSAATAAGASSRVRDALSLIMASPEYLVQK